LLTPAGFFIFKYQYLSFGINMKKRRVVIGVLGTVLDKRGKRANRFKKWRPTVGLCQQADFPVDRLELLHQPRDESMAQKLIDDIAQLSPHTEVRPHTVEINDPWDFEEVYAAFLDFANRYRFDTENEEYLVHITTGTHVAQICWFLLTEARYLPPACCRPALRRKAQRMTPSPPVFTR
jgi:transcriptional regulatory protein RtcR